MWLAVSPATSTRARGLRLRDALHQPAPADAARRRRRAHLRRAAALDAHLARPREARGLPPHARRTSRTRCAARTSRSPPGASSRASASSRCCRRPTCRPRSSSAPIVIRDVGGYPVRIRDVARVELAPARRARHHALQRATRRSSLGVIRSRSRTRSTSPRPCAPRSPRSTRRLPEGMRLELVYDSSVFIDESITVGVPAPSSRRSCWWRW